MEDFLDQLPVWIDEIIPGISKKLDYWKYYLESVRSSLTSEELQQQLKAYRYESDDTEDEEEQHD